MCTFAQSAYTHILYCNHSGHKAPARLQKETKTPLPKTRTAKKYAVKTKLETQAEKVAKRIEALAAADAAKATTAASESIESDDSGPKGRD